MRAALQRYYIQRTYIHDERNRREETLLFGARYVLVNTCLCSKYRKCFLFERRVATVCYNNSFKNIFYLPTIYIYPFSYRRFGTKCSSSKSFASGRRKKAVILGSISFRLRRSCYVCRRIAELIK